MTKSKGLSVILALFLSLGIAFAQTIQLAGVKKASDCEFATRPLLGDLPAVGFPKDWTIVVACNQNVWRYLQLRGNAIRTNTAYTNVENRITVINGMMYMETLPLKGSTHHTPLAVLMHEHGHVLCNCNNEEIADNVGLRVDEESNARLDARSLADLLRKAQRGDHWAQSRVGSHFPGAKL